MICLKQKDLSLAEVAQLVEHNLAKVGVADSSSVFRSWTFIRLEWWNGRHEGLKLPWPVMAVRVQVPLRVPICNELLGFSPLGVFPVAASAAAGFFLPFPPIRAPKIDGNPADDTSTTVA